MTRPARFLTAVLAVLAACGLLTAGAATGSQTKSKGRADSGTAYISITHSVNGIQFAAGNNTDRVLGEGDVTYVISLLPGPTGTFKVTSKRVILYTGTGSLSGTGSATVIATGNTQRIADGRLSLTKGAGSQKHHSLVATFTGTADLTTNQIVFKYKGTYK